MSFPGSIPSYTGFTSGHTLQADAHASQHNSEQADIVAIATKVGTGSSTSTNNTVLRGNGTGTSTWAQLNAATDISGVLGASNGGTGFNALTSLLSAIYPVGTVYSELTGTNPATTFGFGSWTQFGQGQVLVGQKTGDANFGTVLGTGGEATHVLSSAEMPVHTHTVTDPGHTHTENIASASGGGASGITGTGNLTGNTLSTQSTNSSTTGITNANAGSGSAHNNLQPYVVIYFWQRTA